MIRLLCVPCARAESERSARLERAEEQAAASLIRATTPPGRSPMQDALWWGRQLRPIIDGSEVVWGSTTNLPVSAIRGGIVVALSKAGLADGDPARLAVALAEVFDDAGVLGVDTAPVGRRLGAGYRELQGWLLGPLPGPVRGERVTSVVLSTRTSILLGRAEWMPDGVLEPVGGFEVVRGVTKLVVPLVINVVRRIAAADERLTVR